MRSSAAFSATLWRASFGTSTRLILKFSIAATFASASAVWSVPANAVTFDFSTLNASVVGRVAECPCYDPVSGTQIFSGATASQTNYGWTEGTTNPATLYLMGGTHGNNAGKMYIPSGAPQFALPGSAGGPPALNGTETALGNHNTQGTGYFAQSNGFPLYFWFGSPGTASAQGAPGAVSILNSLYLADAGVGVTITGYSDFGITPVDSYTLTSAISFTPQQIVLDWTNIEYVAISGGSGFYVNDIEVNDSLATPLPAALPLFATGLGALALLGWRRKRPARPHALSRS
jgi:hypothetical protein